jgi:hypothetical protein
MSHIWSQSSAWLCATTATPQSIVDRYHVSKKWFYLYGAQIEVTVCHSLAKTFLLIQALSLTSLRLGDHQQQPCLHLPRALLHHT